MKRKLGCWRILLPLLVIAAAPLAHGQEAAERSCSDGSLNGHYAVTLSGQIPGVGPISGVSLVEFDGNGHVTSVLDHIVVNGVQPPSDWRRGTGTYHVDNDCKGKFRIEFPGETDNAFLLVGKHGREFRAVVADPGANVIIDGIAVGKP